MNPIRERIRQLRVRDPHIAMTLSQNDASVRTLRGKLSDPLPADELKRAPFEAARKFFVPNKDIFANIDERELIDVRATTTRRGNTNVLFQQKYGDAQVLGGTLAVVFDDQHSVALVKSHLAHDIDAPRQPRINSDQAAQAALRHNGGGTIFKGEPPSLVVADARTLRQTHAPAHKYFLCWRLFVLAPEGKPGMDWIYYVDASTGAVLVRQPADQTGTGVGRYSTGVGLRSEPAGPQFRLRDAVTTSVWPAATHPVIHDFDDHGSAATTLAEYSVDSDDAWDLVAPPVRTDDQRPEVDLDRFVGYVVDYFYQTFGYEGWDGLGRDAEAHAHNEKYANNAYWSGSAHEIFFADGDGVTRDFMCPLDTVAHEYAHGVKYYLDVLQSTMLPETGALNEATSDLLGGFVALLHPADDPLPWNHGQQYRIDGTSGRKMDHPSLDTAAVVRYDATSEVTKANSCRQGYYPDHYSIRYMGAEDGGGIHWNAPIISHALYLMINGGTNRVSGQTVTGIGVGPIEQMLWEALSVPLVTNTSDFADFRLAMIEACQLLYPDNVAYLATVKAGFQAVGIGPDLFIRDRLVDTGQEPDVASCMSPDIIVRQAKADAATLAQIGDFTNGSLGQDMELGTADNYVYFRLQNRGSSPASGTFRLFLSPVSTFPTPATWHEVGHYDFPNIGAAGGTWAPPTPDDCLTIPAALMSTLGTGHYCFVGIIESDADPAPDRLQIDTVDEFHAFIAGSNNYAWRNCNLYDNVHPNDAGEYPTLTNTFKMTGFDANTAPKVLEIDARDLPPGTDVVITLPAAKLTGAKAFETPLLTNMLGFVKHLGALEEPLAKMAPVGAIPLGALTDVQMDELLRTAPAVRRETTRPLRVTPGKVMRIGGMALGKGESIPVQFALRFPPGTGRRDVALAFRERRGNKNIGQMNYIFRVRDTR